MSYLARGPGAAGDRQQSECLQWADTANRETAPRVEGAGMSYLARGPGAAGDRQQSECLPWADTADRGNGARRRRHTHE